MTTPPNPLVYLPQRMQSDRLKYPGLIPAETVVLRAWLKTNEALFVRFDYNVRLGPPYVSPTPLSPAVQRNADLLHQLRLDAVGWNGIENASLPAHIEHPREVYDLFPQASATIIDAKRRATNAAIGQILSYRDNWMSENPQCNPPDLLLVCHTYAPNITPSLLANRIQLNTITADFTILRNRKP